MDSNFIRTEPLYVIKLYEDPLLESEINSDFYIGTNSSGINAFFIKKHLSAKFKTKIQEIKTFPSKDR